MKNRNPIRLRLLASILTALLLAGCLAACSSPGGAPTPAPPAATEAPSGAQGSLTQELPAAGDAGTRAELPRSFEGLEGRWMAAEAEAELWIQYTEGESVAFSLLIPGSAAINNAVARQDQDGAFSYVDPYLSGVGAAGTLRLENGQPVLTLSKSNLQLPENTVLHFRAEEGAPDYAALYAPVLEAYREHERAGGGLENWYGDEPGYVHVGLSDARRFGCQFWDLDRDGSPELILGALYSEEETREDELGLGLYWHNLVLDLYTLEGGAPRYVVNSGERYRYSLSSDGLLYYVGSSGASYTSVATYALQNGQLRMETGIAMDGSDDECFTVEGAFNPERVGYTSISVEEFIWLRDNYERLYLYDRWAPLSLRPVADWLP